MFLPRHSLPPTANESEVLFSGTNEACTWITNGVNCKERRGMEYGVLAKEILAVPRDLSWHYHCFLR